MLLIEDDLRGPLSGPGIGRAGRPGGVLGRVVAAMMGRLHAPVNARAVAALEAQSGETVLEIGCGRGDAIHRLIGEARVRRVVAVDHAPGMVAAARRLNRAAMREGLVDVREASVSKLPFRDGTFDAALAVESVQFWPRLRLDLVEVLRVLKPGGRLVIAMRVTLQPRARRRVEIVLRALPGAGFVEVAPDEADARGLQVALIGAKRPIWAGGAYDASVP